MAYSADGTHVLGQITAGAIPEYTMSTRPTAQEFGNGQAWFSDIKAIGNCDGVSWTFEKNTTRSSTVKIALYGDSNADLTTETDQDVSINYTTTFPASGQTTTLAKILNVFGLQDQYSQAYVILNAGLGGTTTQSWLDRDAAVASSSRCAVLDIISAGVDVVLFRGQSINDYISSTAAQITTATLDAQFVKWKEVLSRLLSSGMVVIASGHPGYNLYGASATDDVIARKAALVYLNTKIKDYIISLNNPRLFYINPMGLVSDSTGGYLQDMSTDGTHLSYPGSYALAQKEAEIIEALYGKSPGIRYTGTNLTTNQLFLTTTSETYGTLATGITLTATNGTKANAKIESIDGTIYQTMEVTPNGNGTDSVFIFLYAPITEANLTIVSGDRFGIEYDTFIQMTDGSVVVGHDSSSYFEVTKTGSGKIAQRLLRSRSGGATRVKIHPVFNPIQIDEATANIATIKLYHLYTINPAQNISTTPVKVGIGNIRVVKQ